MCILNPLEQNKARENLSKAPNLILQNVYSLMFTHFKNEQGQHRTRYVCNQSPQQVK